MKRSGASGPTVEMHCDFGHSATGPTVANYSIFMIYYLCGDIWTSQCRLNQYTHTHTLFNQAPGIVIVMLETLLIVRK